MESEEFGSALKYFAVDIEELVVILTRFNPFFEGQSSDIEAFSSSGFESEIPSPQWGLCHYKASTNHGMLFMCFQALTAMLFVAFLKEKIKI